MSWRRFWFCHGVSLEGRSEKIVSVLSPTCVLLGRGMPTILSCGVAHGSGNEDYFHLQLQSFQLVQ